MGTLHNINSVYSLIKPLYGIEVSADDFEEIVMAGWEQIGNRHTRLYRYIADTENGELQLPCNSVGDIESVHIPIPDSQITSNKTDFGNIDSAFVERYIDCWKRMEDPFFTKGKLVKYKEGDDILYFNRDYKKVMVVYHGIIADEDTGLPLINDKEEKALAAFVAWREVYKDSLKKRDKNTLQFAKDLEAEWLRKCNAARIVEHLTQNDMNAILDVKSRWDRKQYGKSLKPIL